MTFAAFAPSDTFPYPKANNLDKIVAAVFVIDHGANTGDSVAIALDINKREGAYYADAAGYLDLVARAHDEGIKTYTLTARGYALVEVADDPVALSLLIRQYVAERHAVQVYAEEGEAGVDELMSHADYSDRTGERRSACIRSWYNQSRAQATLTTSIAAAMTGVKGRAAEAAKAAEEARQAWLATQRVEQRNYGTCPDCFMELPASGLCC